MNNKKFDEETKDLNPLETLRFFFSQSQASPQEWLDSERLFFDIEKQLAAKEKEVKALRDGIARLASNEAFHVPTARVSTELVLRMEYAENLLIKE